MLIDEIYSEDLPEAKDCISPECWKSLSGNKLVLIWGTGAAGQYAYQRCVEHGLQPAGFGDNDCSKNGTACFDTMIYTGEDFYSRFPPEKFPAILISSVHFSEIARQLQGRGYSNLFYWDTHLLRFFQNQNNCNDSNYSRFSRELPYSQREKIERAFSLFQDDRSKLTFLNLLKYRLYLKPEFLMNSIEEHAYFGNDVFPSFQGKTFVDCGAYTGDTLSDFLECPDNRAEEYWAIEPDKHSFQLLETIAEKHRMKHPDMKIQTLNYGAWKEQGLLTFRSQNDGTSLNPDGDMKIPVDSIDRLIGHADFIKMDIEGAEREALSGARKTISGNSNIQMAICVYHLESDLWDLPLLIHQLYPNGRLALRHHANCVNETVCYAF